MQIFDNMTLDELYPPMRPAALYEEALTLVHEGKVPYRSLRWLWCWLVLKEAKLHVIIWILFQIWDFCLLVVKFVLIFFLSKRLFSFLNVVFSLIELNCLNVTVTKTSSPSFTVWDKHSRSVLCVKTSFARHLFKVSNLNYKEFSCLLNVIAIGMHFNCDVCVNCIFWRGKNKCLLNRTTSLLIQISLCSCVLGQKNSKKEGNILKCFHSV